MINSKQKGKRGELEFVKYLKDKGYDARRGQQFKGTPDSPDIICDSLPYHFEVKRTERLNVYDAMAQATRDAGDYMPVVVHKKNNSKWIAIMNIDDLFDLIELIDG